MPKVRPMSSEVREWLARELANAKRASDPWPILERAHIVSQPWVLPHTRVHWAMLRIALRERDSHEALGQVIRLIVAGPGSLAGKYPVGNTGRTTMGLTEVAVVPDELQALLNAD